MVIDDGEHLEVPAVGEIRIDLVGVDQTEEVHPARFAHALDLAELEPEELHEGAVLAVAELMAVADRRLADPQALGDMRLRDGAGDAVRVWMATQGDEHVLAPRCDARASAKPRARCSATSVFAGVRP